MAGQSRGSTGSDFVMPRISGDIISRGYTPGGSARAKPDERMGVDTPPIFISPVTQRRRKLFRIAGNSRSDGSHVVADTFPIVFLDRSSGAQQAAAITFFFASSSRSRGMDAGGTRMSGKYGAWRRTVPVGQVSRHQVP